MFTNHPEGQWTRELVCAGILIVIAVVLVAISQLFKIRLLLDGAFFVFVAAVWSFFRHLHLSK